MKPRLSTFLVLATLASFLLAGCSGSPDRDPSSDDPSPGASATSGGPGSDGFVEDPMGGSGPGASTQSGTATGGPVAGGGSGSGAGARGPLAVALGSAAGYAILSKAGVSTTGTTTVVGDVGVSPISASAITGFGLILDASNQFATSSLVTGQVRAADFAPPTPTAMTQAVADMGLAYDDAAGRSDPTATELGAGNIAGMTLAPGLYKWGTGLTIPSDVVLSGGPNDVWIFQVAQGLSLGTGASIVLSGGAQARNVFWQVAEQATLASGSHFHGTILSYNAIVLETGASLDGRALAQTAVTLDANAVTRAA